LSTILDALRKAQDDTETDKRQVRVEEIPPPGEAPEPSERRPRRALTWLVGIAAVLGLAFVGGLALGNRVSDMFLAGRKGTSDAVPEAAKPEVAKPAPAAPVGEPREVAPSEAPAQVAQADPPARRSERRAATAARREAEAEKRQARAAVPQPPDEEPVPTPYGRLHVFGAPEGGGQEGASAEDRAARLRQLREKMLRARREASERGNGGEEAAVAIVVPPPPGGAAPAPAPAAVAEAPAVAMGVAPEPPPAAEQPRLAAAAPEVAEPPPEPVVRRPTAVGVSVGGVASGAPAATGGEIRDPDIAMPDENPAPAAVAEEPAPEPEAPVAVAAVPPAAVAPPPAAPAPPVLRRSPGGAPQVSINILQWSAEPGRRFAFVSIDGGGMTQVREGDRIGTLTVKHIHQQMIEFGFNDSTFLLRAN